MNNLRSSLLVLSFLLLIGAGCFGGGNAPTAGTGGIWVSDNDGSSWVSKSVLPTATGSASINGLDILAIAQDPSDSSVVYVGSKTSGLFYSLDGGESWQRPKHQVAASGAVLAIEVDPRNVCTYYVLKSDRVLKTDTCGREFDTDTYVETRSDETLTALALDWYNPDSVFIGTSEGDVLRSLDGGQTWKAVLRARNNITDIEISNSDSRIVMAGTRSDGIYRSTDSGANWTNLETAFKDYKKANNVFDFSQTDDGSRLLVRSAYGLTYSDDAGLTWQPINLVSSAGEVLVRAAALSATNKQVIYYSSGSTFYTSNSGGDAWSTTNLPTTRAASVIYADEGKNGRVFLGVAALDD